METIIHKVSSLAQDERGAVERLVGHPLREDQELVIQVVGGKPAMGAAPVAGVSVLPDWCGVFAGMSDDEMAAIEKSIIRTNTSRPFE